LSAILFHRSPLLSLFDLRANFDKRVAAFQRLNEELRQQLEVRLEKERQIRLIPLRILSAV
jgi:hypothetical protein